MRKRIEVCGLVADYDGHDVIVTTTGGEHVERYLAGGRRVAIARLAWHSGLTRQEIEKQIQAAARSAD